MKIIKEIVTYSRANDFNLMHTEPHKRYILENNHKEQFYFEVPASEDPIRYLEDYKYLEGLTSEELHKEAIKLAGWNTRSVSYLDGITSQRRCNEIAMIWNRDKLLEKYSAEELDRNVIVHTWLEGNEQYTTTTMRMLFIDYLNLTQNTLMKREMEEVA